MLAKDTGNEIQLADAINFQVQKGAVNSVVFERPRFDCGSIDHLFSAINNEYKKKGNK